MPVLSSLRITRVQLRVTSQPRALAFYRDVLGLHADGGVLSAFPGGPPLIELIEQPKAQRRPLRTAGLYHIAIRVPDGPALSAILQRLMDAHWPLTGAMNHMVCDAVYLADPEGNGLEFTADRPRERWPMENGRMMMGSKRIHPGELLGDLPAGATPSLSPEADIGHLHLQVGSLRAAESFFCKLLGLDVVQRGYPGALFISAGGYHHHIAVNTWGHDGAQPPPAGSLGLAGYTLTLPDFESWLAACARASAAGSAAPAPGKRAPRILTDPAGAAVTLDYETAGERRAV